VTFATIRHDTTRAGARLRDDPKRDKSSPNKRGEIEGVGVGRVGEKIRTRERRKKKQKR